MFKSVQGFAAIILCVGWLMVLSPGARAFDLTPDAMGIQIWHGVETTLSDGWGSRFYDFQWDGVIVSFEKYLWDSQFRIQFEPGLGLHQAEGSRFTRDGFSIGFDLWLLRDFTIPGTKAAFYVGPGVGLMTMIPGNRQPELGNSGIYGMFGGRSGIRFPILEQFQFLLEFRLNHYSDIPQTDMGRNYQGVVTGLTWPF